MSSITVVDRPLCCSSGVCGPDPDPVLARFADDVAWLATQGVTVERINPSSDPEAFLAQTAVAQVLETRGNSCLPALLVGGEVVSTGQYPGRDELAHLAGIEATGSGLITPAVRELVAIGAAIAANCEPCFRFHYAEGRKLGLTREDMTQAVAVAQTVKDTPAQAILDLADRYLSRGRADPDPASSATCCRGPAATDDEPPANSSGCCC